ncbi:hypothetical protein Tco_0168591 [Tanacetum coccineum]
MPFGLCNAPGTFQRCMMAIFHDMIEKTMEVFMDDFSVFGEVLSLHGDLTHLKDAFSGVKTLNLALKWRRKANFIGLKKALVCGGNVMSETFQAIPLCKQNYGIVPESRYTTDREERNVKP